MTRARRRSPMTLVALAVAVAFVAWSGGNAAADEKADSEPTESDFSNPPGRTIEDGWSNYDLGPLTFKWGLYTILDFGNALQSDESAEQVEVEKGYKIRDFRFTFSGKLALERPVTYTMGLMYDGPTASWFPRETGIQVGIPELWGNVFIGRQKAGVSLNKVTVGYAVWTMERMPIGDATIPIMNDGIKWLGGLPSKRANWNAAFFHNQLPKSPATDWYDNAFAARFAVLPMRPDEGDDQGSLLHLGLGYYWGDYADGETDLTARPESSTAPDFLDSGIFPADQNHMFVPEAYYRKGSWLVGGEYILNFIRAPEVGDPLVHGGEAFVAWIVTGEVRPYVDLGGKLGFVQPKSSAFSGGTGALEAVLHYSYADFDDGDVAGGRFWRVTPQLNWYVDNMVSLRANYGLGRLDRFGTQEFTHFLQFRVQFQIE